MAQGTKPNRPVEEIRAIDTANLAFVDNFAGSAGVLGFEASNPVDGTTRDCERLAVCLLATGASGPPGFENELFTAAAGGSLAAHAHGNLLNLLTGLEVRVDISGELFPSPGDCSIGA